MGHDPGWWGRRSPRLQGYDYAQQGAYFVTSCTQHRVCLLGDVIDGEMRLNDAGRMIAAWWAKLPEKYPHLDLDAWVIMPNHVHGIVVIMDDEPQIALDRMMQWLKTMTTNAYIRGAKEQGWEPFPGKLWQRSYHDKIVRHARALEAIRDYIVANPAHWAEDSDHPAHLETPRSSS